MSGLSAKARMWAAWRITHMEPEQVADAVYALQQDRDEAIDLAVELYAELIRVELHAEAVGAAIVRAQRKHRVLFVEPLEREAAAGRRLREALLDPFDTMNPAPDMALAIRVSRAVDAYDREVSSE